MGSDKLANRVALIALLVMYIIGAPLTLFFLLVSDTLTTQLGLRMGLHEANPVVGHYNVTGVTDYDFYIRFVLSLIAMIVFIISNVWVLVTDKSYKYYWLMLVIPLVLWFLMIGEAIVVYSNLVRIVTLS